MPDSLDLDAILLQSEVLSPLADGEILRHFAELAPRAEFKETDPDEWIRDLPPVGIDTKSVLTCASRKSRKVARQERAVVRAIRRRWAEPIRLLSSLNTVSVELGSCVSTYLQSGSSHSVPREHWQTLVRLHARGCQIADELLSLFESGHPDAMLARWRSLFELAVVARVIAIGGPDTSTRFRLHRVVDAARGLREYATLFPKDQSMQRDAQGAEQRVQELCDEYGRGFRRDFGWAGSVVGKSNPKWSDLVTAAGTPQFGVLHRSANQELHASSHSAYIRWGSPEPGRQLFIGKSDEGFAEPVHATALSLNILSGAVIQLVQSQIGTASLLVCLCIAEQIGEQVVAIHADGELARLREEMANSLGKLIDRQGDVSG